VDQIATGFERNFSSDDVAEYMRRVSKLREIMREHGFDAIVASDYSVPLPGDAYAATPHYTRYLSGFNVIGYGNGPRNALVIVPLSGELSLVVPPGILRGWANLARAGSWIKKVVSAYSEDPAWELRTRWGLVTDQASDVAQALKASGLERGRIGVSGTWTGYEETKAQLPNAHFESTVTKDANGRTKDLLESLIGANSPWEIRLLERAETAADATVNTFIKLAHAGATIQEATLEARIAGMRQGAEDIHFVGSVGVDPWTWGNWSHATPGAQFRKGALYSMELARCTVDGYTVQKARSFVVGSPTTSHGRIYDAAMRSMDVLLERIQPGLTGEQLWEIGLEPVKRAGLEAWSRSGHYMGFEFNGPQRLNFMPGNRYAVYENEVVMVHPAIIDKATGAVGIMGNTILLENGRWRYLSAQPPRYEITG
jgi:Xaa-Pro aminopeptidase